MRKVVLFMHNSLDGFCATAAGGLEWIPYDDELMKFGEKVVKTVGSPLYGHVTYDMMKGYWSSVTADPSASEHDKEHVRWMEDVQKVVFSTTLKDPDWKNTKVISVNILEEVMALKGSPGKDLVIFGSPTLALSLMKLGLIDEFRFTFSPVILGEGKSFLREAKDMAKLELIESEVFKSGVVALRYKVKKIELLPSSGRHRL